MGKKSRRKKKKGKSGSRQLDSSRRSTEPTGVVKANTSNLSQCVSSHVDSALAAVWSEERATADVLCDQHDYDMAIECYGRAVAIAHKISNPGALFRALLGRGICFMKQNDWENASHDMSSALFIKNSSLVAFVSLLYIRLRSRDIKRVLADAKTCIRMIQAKTRYGYKAGGWKVENDNVDIDVERVYNSVLSGLKDIEGKINSHLKRVDGGVGHNKARQSASYKSDLLSLLFVKKECMEVLKRTVAPNLPLLMVIESQSFVGNYTLRDPSRFIHKESVTISGDIPPLSLGVDMEFLEYLHSDPTSSGITKSEYSEMLASRAYKKQDYEAALVNYSKAQVYRPLSSYYASKKAQAFFFLGKFHSAIAETSSSFMLEPSPSALLLRAMSWLSLDQPLLSLQDSMYAYAYASDCCNQEEASSSKDVFFRSVENLLSVLDDRFFSRRTSIEERNQMRRARRILLKILKMKAKHAEKTFHSSSSLGKRSKDDNLELKVSRMKLVEHWRRRGIDRGIVRICANPQDGESYEMNISKLWLEGLVGESEISSKTALRAYETMIPAERYRSRSKASSNENVNSSEILSLLALARRKL